MYTELLCLWEVHLDGPPHALGACKFSLTSAELQTSWVISWVYNSDQHFNVLSLTGIFHAEWQAGLPLFKGGKLF